MLSMDFRIYFALVCGARSCFFICVYMVENIDCEFEDVVFFFFELEIDVEFFENGDVMLVVVSKIVGEWYKFDFGDFDVERLRYVLKYMC